jgi:hypothetical protein
MDADLKGMAMSLLARLKYAAFLTVAIGMAFGMIGSVAGLDVAEILSSPGPVVALFAVAFILAPWVEKLLPFKRRGDHD